jgi:hypothetical protein
MNDLAPFYRQSCLPTASNKKRLTGFDPVSLYREWRA